MIVDVREGRLILSGAVLGAWDGDRFSCHLSCVVRGLVEGVWSGGRRYCWYIRYEAVGVWYRHPR